MNKFSFSDILKKIWSTEQPVARQLEILFIVIESYLTSQGTNKDPNRLKEGLQMKNLLMELNMELLRKGKLSTTCTLNDIYSLIVDKQLHMNLMEKMMRKNTFTEWVNDYKKSMKDRGMIAVVSRKDTAMSHDESRIISAVSDGDDDSDDMPVYTALSCVDVGGSSDPVASSSFTLPAKRDAVSRDAESVGVKKRKSCKGLDSLFDMQPKQYEIQQSISKIKNNCRVIMKSPGEIGYRLIRLEIYDVNKITGMERRQWWKVAEVRAEFLTSSESDLKQRLTQQLLDAAADDLKIVKGVRKEVIDIYP
ncbi:PREDICTED: uncharacterized protein LOC105461758 [Wasmannia auropunctata]|uniref:uncharacterized protein LOC105461758 n=1 Tax=Wasmannia auropunctata TaxID=64793 RepID=UPI0005ED8312|nr:PREDICTED: uncharacterized protein LOC105461758 [Wasmannia auropunctata]